MHLQRHSPWAMFTRFMRRLVTREARVQAPLSTDSPGSECWCSCSYRPALIRPSTLAVESNSRVATGRSYAIAAMVVGTFLAGWSDNRVELSSTSSSSTTCCLLGCDLHSEPGRHRVRWQGGVELWLVANGISKGIPCVPPQNPESPEAPLAPPGSLKWPRKHLEPSGN